MDLMDDVLDIISDDKMEETNSILNSEDEEKDMIRIYSKKDII